MGIKNINALGTDIKKSFLDGAGNVEGVTDEQLETSWHEGQEAALAKGGEYTDVQKFFDYIPRHVFLPWLRALTEKAKSDGGRLTTAEGTLLDALNRLTAAENDINTAEERLTTAVTDIDAVSARVTTAETTIDAVDGRLSTAETDIDALEKRLEIEERLSDSCTPFIVYDNLLGDGIDDRGNAMLALVKILRITDDADREVYVLDPKERAIYCVTAGMLEQYEIKLLNKEDIPIIFQLAVDDYDPEGEVAVTGKAVDAAIKVNIGAAVEAAESASAAAETATEVAEQAAEATEAAAAAAEAAIKAAENAMAEDQATAIAELNTQNLSYLWMGTTEEYEAQKDSLPENTFCIITDDTTEEEIREAIENHVANAVNPHGVTVEQIGAAPLNLVTHFLTVSTTDELETALQNVYNAMPDSAVRHVVVYDKGGTTAIGGGYTFVTLYRTNEKWGCAAAIHYSSPSPYQYTRTLNAGTWMDWCICNPNNALDTEYRTTERYKGKPVYTFAKEIGALPGTAATDTLYLNGGDEIPALKIDDCVSIQLVCSSGTNEGTNLTHLPTIGSVWCTRSAVHIMTTTDLSAMTAEVILKYTKTTD